MIYQIGGLAKRRFISIIIVIPNFLILIFLFAFSSSCSAKLRKVLCDRDATLGFQLELLSCVLFYIGEGIRLLSIIIFLSVRLFIKNTRD